MAYKDKGNTLSLLSVTEFEEYVKNMVFTEEGVLMGNTSSVLYIRLKSNEVDVAWSFIYDNAINIELRKVFPVDKICSYATSNSKALKGVIKEKYPQKIPERCWDCL